MTSFYAQPYDISATGFYFEDAETYRAKIRSIRNDCGQRIEEFELQFIDGEMIDAQLCEVGGIIQADILSIMEKLGELDDDQKHRTIIAVGECGYGFDMAKDDPDDFEIELYEVESMRELAE